MVGFEILYKKFSMVSALKTFMNFKSYRKTLSFGLFPQYISWCLSLFFTADYIILHQYLFLWYCYIGLGENQIYVGAS